MNDANKRDEEHPVDPPLKPVFPPDIPEPSAAQPYAQKSSGAAGCGMLLLGFFGVVICAAVVLTIDPRSVGLLLVLPIFGIALLVPSSTRMVGYGVLLAIVVALLAFLAICGGALMR